MSPGAPLLVSARIGVVRASTSPEQSHSWIPLWDGRWGLRPPAMTPRRSFPDWQPVGSGPLPAWLRLMLTPVAEGIDYRPAGPLTSLVDVPPAALSRIADEPVAICWPVHGLVIQPGEAETLGVAAERFEENQIRPAGRLADVLLGLDPAPLSELREPPRRVVGTCRHFAVLACALLRHRGIASRVRCGFATYFQPGQGLDHWIVEYREDTQVPDAAPP
jgi:hypothetical protein